MPSLFKIYLVLLQSTLLTSALPLATRNTTTLQWGPCDTQNNQSVPFSCARLVVPRDYTDTNSSDTISLNLAKLNATKQPSRGTILFNPGGPGEGGRDQMWLLRDDLLATLGGYHDIVTWDPRGTGVTLPVSCFSDTANATAYQLLNSLATNASNAELERAWAVKTSYALSCAENIGDVGELVGTAFTARDMMQIVHALGEDGMLRYYGQSYGTALGTTVAAMFPDRVDKIALDGVLNPTEYHEGRRVTICEDVQQLAASDATFDGYLAQCLSSPDLCPVATYDRPDLSLHQQVYSALEEIKYNPLPTGAYAGSIVNYGLVKQAIASYLYGEWENLGDILYGLLSRNVTAFSSLATASTVQYPFPGANLPDSLPAIRCSDNTLRASHLDEIKPLIQQFYDTSRVVGDVIVLPYSITCAQWPFAAKERYSGAFKDIATKNPLLFIGNTFDPITSLAGARNASGSFVDSALLVHNGYGHTSIIQPSTCTQNAIQAYFLNGTLPAKGTQCQPDAGLFGPSASAA